MRVVIFAFGSWAKAQNNPPAVILKALLEPQRLERFSNAGVELVGVDTPVSGEALPTILSEVLLKEKPDFSFGVGLGSGRATIDFETTAINTKHYSVADNSGSKPYDERIIDRADVPVGYRSAIKYDALVEVLNNVGIPARLSHHAGTHCCNQLLYLSHHICDQHNLDTKCGFIHVPYLHTSFTDTSERAQPSMALPTMVSAFELILNHLHLA